MTARARRLAWLLTACTLLASCTRRLAGSFTCTSSSQCVSSGVAGVCEPSGACSFPDGSCASGRRYGDLGPTGVAGTCVLSGGGGSGGSDGGGGSTDLATAPNADLAMKPGTPGMITLVGSTKVPAAAPSNGAIVIPLPAGVSAGDLLFAAVYAKDQAAVIATPQGWTEHIDLPVGDFHAAWFYKLAGASEPQMVTFAISASPKSVAATLVAYRGVAMAAPIDTATNRTFNGTSYVVPSIVTTRANDRLLAMLVDETQGAARTQPAGMTTVIDDSVIVFFDEPQPAAGATGDKSAGTFPGVGAVDVVALVPAP